MLDDIEQQTNKLILKNSKIQKIIFDQTQSSLRPCDQTSVCLPSTKQRNECWNAGTIQHPNTILHIHGWKSWLFCQDICF